MAHYSSCALMGLLLLLLQTNTYTCAFLTPTSPSQAHLPSNSLRHQHPRPSTFQISSSSSSSSTDEKGSYDPSQGAMTESEEFQAANDLLASAPPTSIELNSEIENSFMQYALSIILGRALPDARDGLKPVHRRILFAMSGLNLTPGSGYRKCARVVGEVLGKYHPHGDTAVYDALVRLAQDFSTNVPLIDGHGNFGSIDADPAAAMRYTECKLTRVANEAMLDEINFDTVDFVPNFDGNEIEPTVLPARLPVLLLNGCAGIAVGMATNVPPHNLGELMDACVALTKSKEEGCEPVSDKELFRIVPAPDFPTHATIMGTDGAKKLYSTGNGGIVMRAVTHIEQVKFGKGAMTRTAIIVTELPYQVNKSALLEKTADMVNEKKIDGIADLRDESDRDGIRIVIELKRDAVAAVVLGSFSGNFLALMGSGTVPTRFTLRGALDCFLDFRFETIRRKTSHQLLKVSSRAHIVLGLLKALKHVDEVIDIIRKAPDQNSARQSLMDAANENLALSEEQANSTKIVRDEGDLDDIDLVQNSRNVIVVTRGGYIKRMPLKTFENQGRGTRGKKGTSNGSSGSSADEVVHCFSCNDHDTLLMTTQRGIAYGLRAFQVPTGGRTAKGVPIPAVLPIRTDDVITSVLPVAEFSKDEFCVLATEQGWIKKTPLAAFENISSRGLTIASLGEGDSLKWCQKCADGDDILIGTKGGLASRFETSSLRPTGRTSRGVKSMKLKKGDTLADVNVLSSNESSEFVLAVTSNGYGKRIKTDDFTARARGGVGVIATKFKPGSNDSLSCLRPVSKDDEVLVITSKGVIVRQKVSAISSQGRAATGVLVQKVDTANGDSISRVSTVPTFEETDE
eukprot:scaffold862_cov221-Chaetoceros_neogracile.AAC.3